jgi:hypothetical protein
MMERFLQAIVLSRVSRFCRTQKQKGVADDMIEAEKTLSKFIPLTFWQGNGDESRKLATDMANREIKGLDRRAEIPAFSVFLA